MGAAHRTLFGKGADFGHQVVLDLLLDLLGALNIDVILARPQIGNLGGCDQSGLILGFCQRHPYAAHEPALFGLAPGFSHNLAAVAPGQGGQIGVVGECRHGRLHQERVKRSEE